MVDKEERRAFGRFLTTASERELAVKRDELTRLVGLEPSFTELARDLRFLLRLTRVRASPSSGAGAPLMRRKRSRRARACSARSMNGCSASGSGEIAAAMTAFL